MDEANVHTKNIAKQRRKKKIERKGKKRNDEKAKLFILFALCFASIIFGHSKRYPMCVESHGKESEENKDEKKRIAQKENELLSVSLK